MTMEKIVEYISEADFEDCGYKRMDAYAISLESIPEVEFWTEVHWERFFYHIGKENHKVYFEDGAIRDKVIEEWSIDEKEMVMLMFDESSPLFI